MKSVYVHFSHNDVNTNIGVIKNKMFMFVIGQCHRVWFLRTPVH